MCKTKFQANSIICGDCLEIMKKIPDHSIDALITDPPYGTTMCRWDVVVPLDQMWEQFNRVVKPDGAMVIFGTEPFSSMLRRSNLESYKYDWIWDKVIGTGFFNAKKQPMRNHELISVFYRKQCTYNPQMTHGHERKTAVKSSDKNSDVYNPNTRDTSYDSTDRYPRSIQVFSRDTQKSSLHPTQKPVALMEYLVRTYTNAEELVLDPFAGVMTSAVACLNTGRQYICIEKDAGIFETGKKRLQEIEATKPGFAQAQRS